MEFANPIWFTALLLIIPYILWYVMFRKKTEPTMRMADTYVFRYAPKSWRVMLMPVLPILHILHQILYLHSILICFQVSSTSDECI